MQITLPPEGFILKVLITPTFYNAAELAFCVASHFLKWQKKRLGMSDQNRQKESGEEWIRLPKPRERCLTTGLSRTSLVELLDERDPETGSLLIHQFVKKRSGKTARHSHDQQGVPSRLPQNQC